MDDIRALLHVARRRLAANRLLLGLHLGLVGAAIVALALVLLSKTSPTVVLPWQWILVGLAACIAASGLAAVRMGRPREMSVAVMVDERLGLKERVSTALAVRERRDAFAQAAVADAVTTARDARTRESLRRNFRVAAPNSSWIGLVIVGAAGLCTLLPQGDLFRRDEQSTVDVATVRREVDASLQTVRDVIERNDRVKDMLKLDGPALDRQDPPEEMLKTPDELKRDAIRKLDEIERKLEEVLKGPEAQQLSTLKEKLEKLEPTEGATKDLGEAIKEGDFQKAKDALENLKKEMDGKTDAEKAAIEGQMKEMAQQLTKLAENQEAVKKALEKAGMDGALANNPAALQQALANAKNLTDAQRQAIQQAAQAQQAAASQCKGMGKAMEAAAKQMSQGGQQAGQQQGNQGGQQGQPGGEQQLGDMLGDLEQAQQMLNDAEAAMNACQSQKMCQGDGMGQCPGNNGNPNSNWGWKQGWQGGPGQAAGGQGAKSAPTPTGTKLQKENVQRDKGPIIAKQLIEGKTVAGTSSIEAQEVAVSLARSMESGVIEEQVPSHLQDVHKHYFGEMKKYVEAKARGENPPEPAAPAPTGAAPSGK